MEEASAGLSYTKGIVLENVGIEAEQPNSVIHNVLGFNSLKMGKRLLHSFRMMVA